ncbi:MAG: hypothetical protein KIT31_11065 [Deltaproteobacteria bacterium]|nr:hypothetical protein [Deltaproteobacteria bacterium]
MISVWYDEDQGRFGPFDARDSVARLEERGVSLQRVEKPGQQQELSLVIARVDSVVVTGLSPEARSRTVLVVFGGREEADWEAERQAHGWLGLVHPSVWFLFRAGKHPAWGLYGRPDVAASAGLHATQHGLQPVGTPIGIHDLIARFLLAAERMIRESQPRSS